MAEKLFVVAVGEFREYRNQLTSRRRQCRCPEAAVTGQRLADQVALGDESIDELCDGPACHARFPPRSQVSVPIADKRFKAYQNHWLHDTPRSRVQKVVIASGSAMHYTDFGKCKTNNGWEMDEFFAPTRKLMDDEERAKLVNYLANHPESGVVIPGTGGVASCVWGLKGAANVVVRG